MSKALWKGWAVCVKPRRGAYWSDHVFARRTRKESIRAYNYGLGAAESFAKDQREGRVKCVRVQLVEVEE